jgi:hypothetical protein
MFRVFGCFYEVHSVLQTVTTTFQLCNSARTLHNFVDQFHIPFSPFYFHTGLDIFFRVVN